MKCDGAEVKVWNASHLFVPRSQGGSRPPYAIILLNAPISGSQKEIFLGLWSGARRRLCADGGANRLIEAFGEQALLDSTVPLPDEVRGDLDSMREDARAFFETQRVPITKRESQYATDLQKCIKAVEVFEQDELEKGQISQPLELVIYGGLSGRFDQTVHTLHVLWTLGAPLPETGPGPELLSERDEDATLARRAKTWVVGEQCLVWILEPGRHVIHVSNPPLGPTCGLLPLATSSGARVISKGLRWNLDGTIPSSLPSFVSTSNQIPFTGGKATIEVETDKTIYWSIELQESE
ncbi:unnamed protein product [Tilletia controversa]|uniref:Thiamin pyrophosphokinase thiamin-binding domain-containing protein n=3 Tax=Tilletia TaxID=13289 RepID=A0A8X7MRS2_9BASI|nr:hypothetical protein CF336_g4556 [Tilletia laevis]KAE8194509.1 hypothetical protein CF328_g4723 [Tilletia controversa]KAE8257035.1 hypothetical protein A4X03_0g4809 [Tilletia caries]KAE8201239.1 hypothetical protein CF335_g3785 [Tilletia laevis]KAE8245765.1 hypothetical protein A4X06_0g5436 [Tilletia controversa]